MGNALRTEVQKVTQNEVKQNPNESENVYKTSEIIQINGSQLGIIYDPSPQHS